MMNVEMHIGALRDILGEKGVVTGADMQAYETGARYDHGKAAFVLRPSTTSETSRAVSYCVRNGIHIIPQSGNTGLVAASTPDANRQQALLSVDRITHGFDFDLDNRSLRVDAGFRLSDINARLQPDGFFFPIDLGADPRIGGMLATNTGGARFLRYGDVRRNTLGITVVLADEDGSVLDLNSDLRKNNTGIDWKQLFIGTSGAFGIITACVLNVEQVPRQTATAWLEPTSASHVMRLLRDMEARLGISLSAFEGISRNAIAATFDHVPSLRNPFRGGHIPDYVILAEITRTWEPREGEQSLDDVLQTVLAEIWESKDAPLADAFVGPPHEIWSLRHAVSEGVKHRGKLIAFDFSFRRGDLMRFCDAAKAEIASRFPDIVVCDFGHIGDGGVHFNLVVPKESPLAQDDAFEKQLRDWVVAIAVNQYGGSFSAEHGIGRKNQDYYDAYTSQQLRDLAAGLKALTSPGGLAAARFG